MFQRSLSLLEETMADASLSPPTIAEEEIIADQEDCWIWRSLSNSAELDSEWHL